MESSHNKRTISTINVTPFVDVVLVLLVIFMITAPLMYSGIKLKLPKTKKVNQLTMTTSQVVLSMSSTGEYFLGKDKILFKEIVPFVQKEFEKQKTDILYLRAHNELKYGEVARLMGFLKKAGVENIALVTETENEK